MFFTKLPNCYLVTFFAPNHASSKLLVLQKRQNKRPLQYFTGVKKKKFFLANCRVHPNIFSYHQSQRQLLLYVSKMPHEQILFKNQSSPTPYSSRTRGLSTPSPSPGLSRSIKNVYNNKNQDQKRINKLQDRSTLRPSSFLF